MDFLQPWLANPTVWQFIVAVLGLLAIYIVVRISRRLLIRHIGDPDIRYRARKLLALAAYVVALLMLSLVFRNRLGGLTILLGATGAGITIALREVILSVAGWLTITFGGLYGAGERIQLAGIRGDVIDISILRTTLMEIGEWVDADLYTGRIVRVANSFVYTQPVFNYSRDFRFLWDEITIPVKHSCDHHLAREILERVVDEVTSDYTTHADEDWANMLRRFRVEQTNIEPVVTLVVNDNWLEYTLRYIVDYKKRRSTRNILFTSILDEFLKTDGRVTIASATHDIVGFPDVTVHLKDDRQKPQVNADQ